MTAPACPSAIHWVQEALHHEAADPARALRLYRTAERANLERSLTALLVAALFPPIAALLAARAAWSAPNHRELVAFAILAFVGFGPSFVLVLVRDVEPTFRRLGWHRRRRWYGRAGALALYLAAVFVQDVIILLGVVVGSLVVLLPMGLALSFVYGGPAEIPAWIRLPISVLAFVYGLGWAFSVIRPRLFPLRRHFSAMLTDLRLGRRDILGFLAGIAVAALLGSAGALNGPFSNPFAAAAGAAATGVLLGVSQFRRVRDPTLADIIRLGQARCLLRLGRRTEARYHIHLVLDRAGTWYPAALSGLAEVLSELDHGRLPAAEIAALLQPLHERAAEEDALDEPCHAVWLRGVVQTYALAGLAEPRWPREPAAARWGEGGGRDTPDPGGA